MSADTLCMINLTDLPYKKKQAGLRETLQTVLYIMYKPRDRQLQRAARRRSARRWQRGSGSQRRNEEQQPALAAAVKRESGGEVAGRRKSRAMFTSRRN